MGHFIRKSGSNTPSTDFAPPPRARVSSLAFPLAMVALPLGAFSAITLAPSFGGPADASAAASARPLPKVERAETGPLTGAELEATQPPYDNYLPGSGTGFADNVQAYFPICRGRTRVTCVVDGDTIWYRGEKIRLVGFDTPEITNPGCANEQRLGEIAARRLQDWLNYGAFSFEVNPDGRSEDRYGRALRVVSRDGENVGEMLVEQGLAERRAGRRSVWC